MVLRHVENRLVVCCRVSVILLPDVIYSQEKKACQHTSVIFCDINALNDLSGISFILPEPSLKEGSHIRVLEGVSKMVF